MRSQRQVQAFVFVLAGAFGAGMAEAQPKVTLNVQPESVDVSPWYQRVQVRVILQNDGDADVVRPELVAFTNDSFELKIGPPSAPLARPGEAVVWATWVERLDRARIPGTAQFEARYTIAGRAGVHQAQGSLTIKAQAATAEPPVEASIHGSFDAITQTPPRAGYLVAKNNLDVPVTISRVAILPQDRESFEEPTATAAFVVPPHSAETRKIELAAARQVRPGTHVVLFQVTAEWDEGGHHHMRTLTLDKEVGVGVVFESDMLKALGVPSFLLLPGCLFLFTMQLLLTLGVLGLDRHSKVPDIPVTSPGFWVVAITFSGVFAWAYRLATRTDYLSRYGVSDLLHVWLSSILAGVLAYLVVGVATMRRRGQRVPDASDGEIPTLEKMARRGLGVQANTVKFKMNDVDLAAYLIERIEDGQTLVWVAPGIVTTWADNDDARALQQRLTELLDQRGELRKIADVIREARDKGYAAVDWDGRGSVPNPYHLKVEAITGYGAPDAIVRIR
jgi:hypothetical protein